MSSDRSRSRSPRDEQAEAGPAGVDFPDLAEELVFLEEEVVLPQADDCIASLLGGTPEQFDVGFAEIIKKNAVRAMIVARYIVANMLPFPHDIVTEHLPALTGITHDLAKKAGSPFAWAFIMMLPLFGLACASSRLWINELFLIPPVVWINLVLDSGANKSGILLAIGEIAGLFERHLLKAAEAELDAAHAQPNEQAMLLKKKNRFERGSSQSHRR